MPQTLKIRNLLLDDDGGLLPRLQRALNSKANQEKFLLDLKEVEVEYELSECQSKINNLEMVVTQTITLRVEAGTAAASVGGLTILSAQMQNLIDAQIAEWFLYNRSVTKILASVSTICGKLGYQQSAPSSTASEVSTSLLKVARMFEFQYSGAFNGQVAFDSATASPSAT